MTKKTTYSILFVDDEKHILHSLRRLLRKENFHVFYAKSAQEGLDLLSQNRIDLIVADIRMTKMDGFQLLNIVRERYPDTTRMILSGYTDQEAISKALVNEVAQEIIFKPWNDDDLIKSIKKALEMGCGKENQTGRIKKIIHSVSDLPGNFTHIVAELQENEDIDINHISRLVADEAAISVQLIHWANSAVFGQAGTVESVDRAVILIGLDMLKGLLISMGISETMPEFTEHGEFNQVNFNLHQHGCATLARSLILDTYKDKQLAEKAFTGGLLHDIGKIVQAGFIPTIFSNIIGTAVDYKLSYIQAENKLNQLDHAQIGSLLAEWWNLPGFLSKIIRFHHEPAKCPEKHHKIISAVHVADVLMRRFAIGRSGNYGPENVDKKSWAMFNLDTEKLDRLQKLLS